MKIQFGSGPNLLDGWLNLQEHDGDITKRLNFEDDTVEYIFTEHCVEHVTPLQGFCFFKECYRILKPAGVLRVVVPDVENLWNAMDQDYINFVGEAFQQWWRAAGTEPPAECNRQVAFETILRCHGHKAAYSSGLLLTFLDAAGFTAQIALYGYSQHTPLTGIDSHWKQMGLQRVILESVVAEGTK